MVRNDVTQKSGWVAVIVAAGRGTRMRSVVSKQFLPLGGKPVWVHGAAVMDRMEETAEIVVVVPRDEVERIRREAAEYGLRKVTAVVPGGRDRQESVRAGISALSGRAEWVMVHDAARPFVSAELIRRVQTAARECGAAVPGVPVKDTVKRADSAGFVEETPERSSLWAVQTPQAFRFELLWRAHEEALRDGYAGTDDASLVERLGERVRVVAGDDRNFKITTPEDFAMAERLAIEAENLSTGRPLKRSGRSADQAGLSGRSGGTSGEPSFGGLSIHKGGNAMFRIGQGFDVHQFAEGRRCVIGGVDIPFERGLLGHSDADVLLHAVADAILGALGEGDIGKHFPDTDPSYKDADSGELLAAVWKLAEERGYALGNLDCTILAQRPKMAPYIPQMIEKIARLLNSETSRVNVKATTTERLGFVGREEGVAAMAVVCLTKA
jgi:2-C-methyl-D-erythritol 4-phosphate cytidylyltransferase/2-C-methyl-D-erythritol 4-phosphate cytidylyltransferase/2-C-methyl-D-erythritol 2,4-cyclodiphosphate synthase